MPLRSLTPLGHQLRSVLATIRGRCSESPARLRHDHFSPPGHSPARVFHTSSPASWREPAALERPRRDVAEETEHSPKDSRLSRRRGNRRKRVDSISEALRRSGHERLAPTNHSRKMDISHLNVRMRGGWRNSRLNAERHNDEWYALSSRNVSVDTIVARYIQLSASRHHGSSTERSHSFVASSRDVRFLRDRGFDVNDIAALAALLQSPSSFEMAQALSARITTRGPQSIPIPILLYLLRRPYIDARSLQIILECVRLVLDHRMSVPEITTAPNIIFILFVRLLRHIRQVWPRAMPTATDILLEYLPRVVATATESRKEQLQHLTYMLNKAMRLIAIPAAWEPLDNNRFQEAAIVRILRFMSAHDPALQTTREGYRAVVVVQLAQPKTAKDRLWAELKALSWPPWKRDRTAMDSDITADDHGMSKAGETLLRMREAGYGPLAWEKVALIYAGWDTDGTPTIQTRVLFEASKFSVESNAAAWVARITATRTMQEAWACYLAWQDSGSPHSQEIYLAILKKLHAEARRKRRAESEQSEPDNRSWQPEMSFRPLFPGDVLEMQPPPSSLHLHTYTRTPAPTCDELFHELHRQGIDTGEHCLAFLMATATTLSQGLDYLAKHTARYPEVESLLQHRLSVEVRNVPKVILAAYIQLLCRFPSNQFPPWIRRDFDEAYLDTQAFLLTIKGGSEVDRLNLTRPLGRAISLLDWQRRHASPPWSSVLKALRTRKHGHLHLTVTIEDSEPTSTSGESLLPSALIADRLAETVLGMMKDSHVDLDLACFDSLCHIVDNTTVTCWEILLAHSTALPTDNGSQVTEALTLMRHASLHHAIRGYFESLFGSDNFVDAMPDNPQLPTAILDVPNPATLHSYIRALGRLADYEGLLRAVRYMVHNASELNERGAVDRNGQVMLRKTFAALRVFLERSWLSPQPVNYLTPESEEIAVLDRLRNPAPSDTIDEICALVESVEEWGGWASEEEIQEYTLHRNFQQFRG